MSRAGNLVGLADLPGAGRNVEGKPYALAGIRQAVRAAPATGLAARDTREIGVDLKSEVVPGLTLDATYNTDFAQVEADQLQVNLTRFSLFFPEKRDFFLENAGIFDFGLPGPPGAPPPLLLFFSRQIGFANGTDVPILGGARLTGRAGDQTIGLLNTYTQSTDLSPAEAFSVARVKRDVGSSGYLGAILTDRRGYRGSGDANTAGGIDGSLWLSRRLNFQGFVAGTETEGAGGDDVAYRVALTYNTDRIFWFAQYYSFGKDFEPSSGFMQKGDQRYQGGFGRYRIRPRQAGLRYVDFVFGGRWTTTQDGTLYDRALIPNTIFNFNSGDNVQIGLGLTEERVDKAFTLTGRLPVPADTYGMTQFFVNASSSPARRVVARLNYRAGDSYGGTLSNVGGEVASAMTPNLNLAVGYNRNAVTLPSGAFTSNISFLRGAYAFSPRFTTDALVQYNNLDHRLVSNLRLDLIHRPGSDLFIVFTEDRGRDEDLSLVSNRVLVSKVTYLVRF